MIDHQHHPLHRVGLCLLALLGGCEGLIGITDGHDLALSSLTVSRGTLAPPFDPLVTHYAVSLTHPDPDLALGATVEDPSVAIRFEGAPGPATLPSTFAIPVGTTPLTVTARATSGVEITYTIDVQRADLALSFSAPINVMGLGMITTVQAADLDGNGLDDLAYTTYDGDLGILTNDGSARFTSRGLYPFANTRGLAIADVVGDAAPDLLVTDGSLWILRGNGDGTFQAPFARGLADAGSLATGQLDADPRRDAIVVDGPGRMTMLFGDLGSMTMGPVWQMSPTTGEPRAVKLAQLDGFAGDEIIALDAIARSITVFRYANQMLTPEPVPIGLDANPTELVALDLDHDQRADLAWLDPYAGEVVIQTGAPTWTRLAVPVTNFPHSLAAGDLDGDGHPDLVMVDGQDVIILRNDGTAHFEVRRLANLVPGANQVAIGDFNHDGRADLVFARTTSTLTIILGVAP